MLRLVCDERGQKGRIHRRDLLQLASWAGLSAMGARTQSAKAAPKVASAIPGFGRAKSVIIVFANGGQSQLETWDPKPEAPLEVRGEFQPIPTTVPGTFICEHLPQVAQLADRFTIVRSMSHADLDHGSAFYLSMSGRYHERLTSNPPPRPTDAPTHAAILKRVRPNREFVHTGIHINGPALVPELIGPGQFGGLLGREFDPMVIGDVTANSVLVPGLTPQDDVPVVRVHARKSLLEALDEENRRMQNDRAFLDMNQLYQQAFQMLDRPETRDAFRLSAEPRALRARYGWNRSAQACLLARRLVEADVPLITVIWNHTNRGQDKTPDDTDSYGWDTHNDIFSAMKNRLLPRFDQSFSALLLDLEDRGLLDETLVICMGEFGRAPVVAREPRFAGNSPGRKHWASVYSIVMAGAGVGRGAVVGQSDRQAGYPTSQQYGPWDVQATMFAALGIDPSGHFQDATSRPYPISIGQPMTAVYQ